jgi:hypothetical protein
MNEFHIASFNTWIGYAIKDLGILPGRDAPQTRQTIIDMAIVSVTRALTRANQMGCPARKALCLRVLNWLNADARRAA